MEHVPEHLRPIPLLERRNQLDPRLLNVSAFDWAAQHGTSPRAQMFGTQLGQRLNIKHPTERRIQTGSERDYGKYTFNIAAPGNITILKVIKRYPVDYGEKKINHNPQTILIYEDFDKKEIGMIDLVDFCTNHPRFGFDYNVDKDVASRIKQDATFEKGEVFRESPAINKNGGFMFGVELETAAVTLPAGAEDGFVISEHAAKLMTYFTYETRVVSCGPKDIPLNMYPRSDGSYGIGPEIMEKIRPDGLLWATRKMDQESSIFDQTPHALKTYYPFFDTRVYAPPGGTVIDIQVYHDNYSRSERTPLGMDEQLMKYYEATDTFYKNILRGYREIRKNPRYARHTVTPLLHDLLRTAMNLTEVENAARPVLLHKKAKLDDWRVVYTIRYENVPGVGSKLSGSFGDRPYKSMT